MNPNTVTDFAAARAAFQSASAGLNAAAERVFTAAESYKDSRPDEEKWLLEEEFGAWNSERDHIFWAETDFKSASLMGDKVKMTTGYTLRCETNTFRLHFPSAWLSLSDDQLTATLAAEWERLLGVARAAKDQEERKQTWQRYQTYLSLREEFEGKPTPEEVK